MPPSVDRKPWDRIPYGQIWYHMGYIHASASEADVAADIRTHMSADATPLETARAIAYAIRCHRANISQYDMVMGSWG